MDDVLVESVYGAARSVRERAQSIPHELWDQGVFRFTVVEQLLRLIDPSRIEIEWNDVSLMVQHGREAALIEIKWFLVRKTKRHEGATATKKGGPSAQNFGVVEKALGRLMRRTAEGRFERSTTVHKYLILAYSPEYASLYGGLDWIKVAHSAVRGTELAKPAKVTARTVDSEVELTFRVIRVVRAD
ncbi:MAG: hypothetical protein IT459_23200 [Planctomycetes bacterium]|nr:hypothetical protein [Planctomycetota bacterium]